jgi:hypothetical protein
MVATNAKLLRRQAQKGLCFYCDKPMSLRTSSWDHIKPKSKGGTGEAKNLALVHSRCNSIKGSIYYEDELLRELGKLQSQVLKGRKAEKLKAKIEFWAHLEAKGIVRFKETFDWAGYTTLIKPNILPRAAMQEALASLKRDREAKRVPTPTPVESSAPVRSYADTVRSWGRKFAHLWDD